MTTDAVSIDPHSLARARSPHECAVGVVTARLESQIGRGSWDAADPTANLYDNE